MYKYFHEGTHISTAIFPSLLIYFENKCVSGSEHDVELHQT